MSDIAEYYEKTLQFHRFWSIDDDLVSTVAMLSTFVTQAEKCTLDVRRYSLIHVAMAVQAVVP